MLLQTALKQVSKLSPQCRQVLEHMVRAGSISNMEAQDAYRIRALPRRIKDLEELPIMGVLIQRERKLDVTGQRYTRYSFISGFEREVWQEALGLSEVELRKAA